MFTSKGKCTHIHLIKGFMPAISKQSILSKEEYKALSTGLPLKVVY